MRRRTVVLGMALAIFLAAETGRTASQSGPGAAVQLWITTSDSSPNPGVAFGLARQPDLPFGADAADGVLAIDINESKVYQRMEGGGASFTDSAAWLVNEVLSPDARDAVMHNLFDPA